MPTCPTCGGAGEVALELTRGPRLHRCWTCEGQGSVTDLRLRWLAEGTRLREQRKASGLTQAQEARRRGIAEQDLVRMEVGRIEPVFPAGVAR